MASTYDRTGEHDLLDAIEHAYVAVKRLREVVTLCEDDELGAACDMPAISLSDDLAALERIISNAIKRQRTTVEAGVEGSSLH